MPSGQVGTINQPLVHPASNRVQSNMMSPMEQAQWNQMFPATQPLKQKQSSGTTMPQTQQQQQIFQDLLQQWQRMRASWQPIGSSNGNSADTSVITNFAAQPSAEPSAQPSAAATQKQSDEAVKPWYERLWDLLTGHSNKTLLEAPSAVPSEAIEGDLRGVRIHRYGTDMGGRFTKRQGTVAGKAK
jgi:hypothetical protein